MLTDVCMYLGKGGVRVVLYVLLPMPKSIHVFGSSGNLVVNLSLGTLDAVLHIMQGPHRCSREP